jgi:hypothetical protein
MFSISQSHATDQVTLLQSEKFGLEQGASGSGEYFAWNSHLT